MVSLMIGRSYAPRSRRPLGRIAAGAAAAGLLLLTGCAAGKDAATIQQRPVTDGIAADSGTLGIRNAGVLPPDSGASYSKGSNAGLELVIVNNGTAPDKLVSVSSSSASSAVLSLTGSSSSSSDSSSASSSATSSESSSASSSTSAGASGSSTSTGGASPSESSSSSSTGSVSPSESSSSGGASVPITVPANNSVKIGYGSDSPSIELVGLNQDLFPAQVVDVTFTFASGATIQAQIPVKLTTGSVSAPSVQVSPTAAD